MKILIDKHEYVMWVNKIVKKKYICIVKIKKIKGIYHFDKIYKVLLYEKYN